MQRHLALASRALAGLEQCLGRGGDACGLCVCKCHGRVSFASSDDVHVHVDAGAPAFLRGDEGGCAGNADVSAAVGVGAAAAITVSAGDGYQSAKGGETRPQDQAAAI